MSYLPEIILFILQFIGIRKYVINGDKEKYKRIIKILQKETLCSSQRYLNGKQGPSGYFISKNCLGKYENSSKYIEEEYVTLVTTDTYFKYLEQEEIAQFTPNTKGESESEEEKTSLVTKVSKQAENIKVYIRSGNYKNFYYKMLSLDVKHIQPINGQDKITEQILQIYKEKNRASVFIHGVSCAGKSSIGYLVAKALNANFCHTFNPSDPGDSFTHMISEIECRNENEDDVPLVIVLEEANEIIRNIVTNKTRMNQEVPTPVHDKSSWCTFMDDMVFYKKVILILTSNESKDDIDKLDTAFLRHGRIHATFSMMKAIEDNTVLESI